MLALTTTIETQEQELAWRTQQLAERDQELLHLRWAEASLRDEILRLERHTSIIEQSRSFRVTAPLRRAATLRTALSERLRALRTHSRHRVQVLRYAPRGATPASAAAAVTTLRPVITDVGGQDPATATSPGRPVTIAAEERTALLAHPPCRLSYRSPCRRALPVACTSHCFQRSGSGASTASSFA